MSVQFFSNYMDVFIIITSNIIIRNIFIALINKDFEFFYKTNLKLTILFNLIVFFLSNFFFLSLTLVLSKTIKLTLHINIIIYYIISIIFSSVIILYIFISHINWISSLFLAKKEINDENKDSRYKEFLSESSFYDVISIVSCIFYISIKFTLQ